MAVHRMLGLIYKRRITFPRNIFGLTIAELPAGLWIIFVGIGMPLLCLVLTTVRFGLFWEAAREASDAACQAQSYASTKDSSGDSQAGAIIMAQNMAVNIASMFPGVNISSDDVNCYIIITPLANMQAVGNPANNNSAATVVGPNTALTTAPDTTLNLYQIRVDVNGKIQPVLPLNFRIFGAIPGLTTYLPVTISMIRVMENPQGLYSSSTNSSGGN